jgi:uncharacterized protein
MKLNLDRLHETPAEFEFQTTREWWMKRAPDSSDGIYTLIEPFSFRLTAYRMGNEIYLEGTAEGVIEVECSRCLARYRHALRDDYRLVLEKAGERVPPDPEGVEALARDGLCLTDELESGWVRGSEIRLDAFLAEVASLAMPVQPLCSEDCAGLCPRCGEATEGGGCTCNVDAPDESSPFAVLAKLRKDLPG